MQYCEDAIDVYLEIQAQLYAFRCAHVAASADFSCDSMLARDYMQTMQLLDTASDCLCCIAHC